MPNPGQANNALGINSFSGPMGEKEPQYGAVERAKQLKRAAPVRTPAAVGAPQRAKRRAVGGGSGTGPTAAAPAPQVFQAGSDVNAQQSQFWSALLADPEASPLTRQYAEQALGQAS